MMRDLRKLSAVMMMSKEEKDLEEFAFAKETTVSIAERSKGEDVFAVCLESDDEDLLVPLKIYKIGLRGDKARVIDEEGEVAIYPLSFFMVLSLPEESSKVIEKHLTNDEIVVV